MTRLLGAILAGGRATRFGSDKALALLNGRALIDRVADALRPQVDALVVVGRTHPGIACTPDRPAPDLGPLGGIAGALHHAATHGFDSVLTVPCDAPDLPDDLPAVLRRARTIRPGPAPGHNGPSPSSPFVDGSPSERVRGDAGEARPMATADARYLIDLPVIGLWPTAALATLDALLAGTGSRSVRAFAERIGAHGVAGVPVANVNTPGDLARIAAAQHD